MNTEEQERRKQGIEESELPCPKCGHMHKHGQSYEWSDKTYGPADVLCDCDLIITVIVPLISINKYGWLWVIKKDNQTAKFK